MLWFRLTKKETSKKIRRMRIAQQYQMNMFTQPSQLDILGIVLMNLRKRKGRDMLKIVNPKKMVGERDILKTKKMKRKK